MKKPRDNKDYIRLQGLRLRCRIGVTPRERRRRQMITADIAIRCDLRRSGKSDSLGDTIDYAGIVKAVIGMARERTFCLLESLAENIAEICLARQGATQVIIKVGKRGFVPELVSAAVEINRTR